MSVTAYPTLRLKLTMPQALKLQFLPAIPGSNAALSAAAAKESADAATVAANNAAASAAGASAATTGKVDKAGDTMTGFLTLNNDPSAVLHAATKRYVDTGISNTNTAIDTAIATAIAAIVFPPSPPQGRLTLQSLTPVMTTTQSAKTTLFYSPFVGDRVPLFNGTNIVMTAFTELSALTTDATKNPAAVGPSQVLDWFVWSDASTLRLSHGTAWTNDTTRSAGTALTMVNGLLLNNASITNACAAQRGTYVGTTRSNASSQLDWIFGGVAALGLAGFIGVWNMYNRRSVAMFVGDSTDSWTYPTAVWRPANNSNTMRISFVNGQPEDAFSARYKGNLNAQGAVGIGYDVTNNYSGQTGTANPNVITQVMGEHGVVPAAGFHFVNAIEFANSVTVTFYGDIAVPLWAQTGIHFNWLC